MEMVSPISTEASALAQDWLQIVLAHTRNLIACMQETINIKHEPTKHSEEELYFVLCVDIMMMMHSLKSPPFSLRNRNSCRSVHLSYCICPFSDIFTEKCRNLGQMERYLSGQIVP